MKKLILVTLLALTSVTALANDRYHNRNNNRNHWIAPLIIGGTIGYIARDREVIYQNTYPQPYQPTPVYNVPQYNTVPDPIPVYAEVYEWNHTCQCNLKFTRQVGWR